MSGSMRTKASLQFSTLICPCGLRVCGSGCKRNLSISFHVPTVTVSYGSNDSCFVLGMWMMLQQKTPEDFVLATGETHSVRQFVQLAFQEIGKEIVWEGKGEAEVGKDKQTGDVLIKVRLFFFLASRGRNAIGFIRDCEWSSHALAKLTHFPTEP